MRLRFWMSRYQYHFLGIALGLAGVIGGRGLIAQLVFGLVLWVALASTAEKIWKDRRLRVDRIDLQRGRTSPARAMHQRWPELARWFGYACIGWFALVATPWEVGPWWVHAPLTIAALTVLYGAVNSLCDRYPRGLSTTARADDAV
jgi:hypothetical protein